MYCSVALGNLQCCAILLSISRTFSSSQTETCTLNMQSLQITICTKFKKHWSGGFLAVECVFNLIIVYYAADAVLSILYLNLIYT